MRIDTRAPSVRSVRSITVTGGANVHLPYRVIDHQPCAGWVRAKLSVVAGTPNGNEKIVRVIRLGRVRTGRSHTVTFRCDLPPALYICSILTVDPAGNVVGGDSTLLRVK